MFQKNTLFLAVTILFFHVKINAQKGFEFRRQIGGNNALWHSLTLPDSVQEHLYSSADFKVFGFTEKGDTVEAPFILSKNTEGVISQSIAFKLLNQSHNEQGFFYTFAAPTNESINTISLNFGDKNFDWRVRLEGSFDQKEWFTILDNYRILGILKDETNYQFTKLNFKEASYRYWRVCVNSDLQPQFEAAELYKTVKSEQKYIIRNAQKTDVQQLNSKKQTVIDIELKQNLPISFVKIKVKDTIDYVRNVTIRYQNDEQNQRPIWHLVTMGSLSSLSENAFKFEEIKAKYLKITVRNGDNVPLNFEKIEVKGEPIELITRFTIPANYYLFYGNKNATPPQYDIENFRKNVPKDLIALTLGHEEMNDKTSPKLKEPFFKNPLWLWAVMLIIMLILGWRTMKMMKANA